MEVENLLVVEDFMVFQGAIFHFHVSSRECISERLIDQLSRTWSYCGILGVLLAVLI